MPSHSILVVGCFLTIASVAVHSTAADPLPSTQPRSFPETDSPALILPSSREIESLKRLVEKDRAIASVFKRDVLAQADAALTGQPAPLERIVYEGRVSGDIDRMRSIEHLADMSRITALVWASVITGDDRYVRAAIRWSTEWIKKCAPTGNDVNDNKLDALLLATQVLSERMSAEDRQLGIGWARDLGRKQRQDIDKSHGNRMAKRIKLMAAAAMVTDDATLRDDAIKHLKRFVTTELRADGTSSDLERRDALSYHVAGLRNILEAALLLRGDGFDPYAYSSPEGASIRKSVEFVNPYARGKTVYPEWVNSKVDLDARRWKAGDEKYRPGRPWQPQQSFEMYRFAEAFDPSLRPILESVRTKAAKELTWLDVVLQARE